MSVYLHRIETEVPEYSSSQDSAAQVLGSWARDATTARIIRHVFLRSGIERRYSVVPDFTEPEKARLFRTDAAGNHIEPTTQARNQVFGECAGPMAVELSRRLVDGKQGFRPEDVTHVITLSCTGFVNPGSDWLIVTELGLSPAVERYNLGFMGCYAAIPALRMARQFCLARPDAVVLVVAVELCSLHMQMQTNADTILANALFSDGAAGALVSARAPQAGQSALELNDFMAALAPEGQGDMAWSIGDRGFNLVLSSYVPDVIEANLGRIVGDLLSPRGMTVVDVDLWAIHPGGKSILDRAEKSLGLEPEQIATSRAVLRDFGNMSSVTILFVLRELLSTAVAPKTIAAMAFGPGLTIECGLLEVVPAAKPPPAEHAELAAAR
jgi:predicted naringenin-chalcone synthase